MPLHCAAAAYVQNRNNVKQLDVKRLIQLKFSNGFLLKQMEKDFKNQLFKERAKPMALQMRYRCSVLRD